MARRGGGFGLVMLVVVAAVVLLLAARAWRDAGPTAIDVSRPAATVDPHGQVDALGALESLPGLNEVRRGADEHARQVQEAIANTE